MASMESVDFSPTGVLFALDTASTRMKNRVLNVFISIIDDWAMRFDMALWENEDEMEMYIQAKRWQDAMRVFSPEQDILED